MLHLLRRAALAAACLCAASAASAEGAEIAAAAAAAGTEPMMVRTDTDEAPRLVVPQAITTTEYLTLSEAEVAAPVAAETPPPATRQPAWVAGSLNGLVARMSSSTVSSRELECLAGAIYFESKSEPLAGQLAVGQVVANRARSGRFPSSYCGVIFQRGQFSFIRGQKMPAIARGSAQWRTAVAIANIVDKALHASEVGKALFFHARRVAPGWRLTRLGTVGNHVFYR